MAASESSSTAKTSMASQPVMQTDVPLHDRKTPNIASPSATNNNEAVDNMSNSALGSGSDLLEDEESSIDSRMDFVAQAPNHHAVNGTAEEDLATQVAQMTLNETAGRSVSSGPSPPEIQPPAEPTTILYMSKCSPEKAAAGGSLIQTVKTSVEDGALPRQSLADSPKSTKLINAETQTHLTMVSFETINTAAQTTNSFSDTVSAATQTSKISSETGAIPKVPTVAATRVKVPPPVKKPANTAAETVPLQAQRQGPRPVQPQGPRPVQPQGPRPAQRQAPLPAPRQSPKPAQAQAPRSTQPQVAIPTPIAAPVFERLPDGAYTFIIFDQETTGFGAADIVQLAAKCGDRTFNQYVLPDKNISQGASEITGITKRNGRLYNREGRELPAVSIQVCLQKFETWMQEYDSPVLVAHNCFNFDSYILTRKILKLQSPLRNKIVGFVDTLPLFKHFLQGRKSYGQEALLKDEGIEYGAHCALEDVTALDVLIHRKNVSKAMMLQYSRAMEGAVQNTVKRDAKAAAKSTLYPLLNANVVSEYMVNKMADCGLTMSHLQAAFKSDRENGIRQLLAARVDGSPRVTNGEKIITDVTQYLASKHS